MTKFVKKNEVENNWYEIDAKNAVVGRLATIISKIIRGKNKTTYTPHMDHGDFVIVNLLVKNFKIKNILSTLAILGELKLLLQKNFMLKNPAKH